MKKQHKPKDLITAKLQKKRPSLKTTLRGRSTQTAVIVAISTRLNRDKQLA